MIRIGIIYLALYAIIASMMIHAPLGYEDSDGFHDGTPPPPKKEGEAR